MHPRTRPPRNPPTQLDRIEALLLLVLRGELIMIADLTQLEASVAANTSAADSAVVLLQGLAAQLAAAATDPAKVRALAAQITASADKLAAAVVANTPVEGTSQDPLARQARAGTPRP